MLSWVLARNRTAVSTLLAPLCTAGSTIRARAQMTPRTFDISNNHFVGWFPEWLVDKVAACKEDITLILDVGRPSSACIKISVVRY